MEHSEINCNLIIACRKGHEKAVLRDVMDLLFPSDPKVRGSILSGGKLCVETTLDLKSLGKLFRQYPIRNLLSIRAVMRSIEFPGDIITGIRELLKETCKDAVRFRRITIKIRASEGWRQEYFARIAETLRGCYGGYFEGVIEKEGSLLLLEIKIPLKWGNVAYYPEK
ncbi:MAG: hypothetical protein ACPLRJ_04825 [Infirmifilum uzonense]|uniref:hypothetical protein n=1 Tax=Infirmifilum uzonense TaxID=1550241 RepID=UPI003C73DB72